MRCLANRVFLTQSIYSKQNRIWIYRLLYQFSPPILPLTKFAQNYMRIAIVQLLYIMYNQFTAIDQKPLPIGKVILNPMDIPRAGKKKKKKLHSKNPYKIKKIRIRGQQAMVQKAVDGLMLLKMLHCQHPKQVITANISFRRIVDINEDHLEYFSNLLELNCSENYIALEKLRKLPAVEKINISHNQIKETNLQKGGFQCLQDLNMSFNFLGPAYIPQLTLIPCLMNLDLSYNQLQELPQSLEHFQLLKKINLEGNNFRSDFKAANFWASLATLPRVEIISVARNKIRGIHTQKLAAGNFSTLIELDFSYNIVENQHNLICARNFISLKKLYITGNPFATNNQYKGLEMEVFARTGAQVIVENLNPYYLKTAKPEKPLIKFDKIIKVETNIFKKKKDALFGLELPKQEDLFSSSSEGEEEQEPQEEIEEPMFVTEQVQKNRKKQKNPRSEISNKSLDEAQMEGQQGQSSMGSIKQSSVHSKSIEYSEFHKVAAELLGGEKEYKKSFDIHTSYKALKKAVQRADDDI